MQEKTLAQGLYDITPLEPLIAAGYTLLTPNQRLARHIKTEWDARRLAAGDRVWQPLSVLPLESWLHGRWDLAVSLDLLQPVTPLVTAQELELWRQVILQQEKRSPEYHLLRPAAAAELANQARDTLIRWQVDLHRPAIRQLFELDQDSRRFWRWLTLFEQRLAAQGQCTLADCLAQLPGLAGRLPASRVALLEFGDLAPLLRTALHALTADVLHINTSKGRGTRLLHAFSDQRAELQAVAAWTAELHHTTPTATIGIVLSDMQGDRVTLEYLLRREFNCLGESYHSLPVNFSTGIALAQAPMARDALAVLALCLQHTTVPSVVGLLRSRFLALPDAQGALAQRFIARLYNAGREVLLVSEVCRVATEISLGDERGLVLGQRLLALNGMRALRQRARPSVWATHCGEVLSLWGWPGAAALDSLEYQQLELWYRTLDELRTYDAVCAPIDFGEALQLLCACCSRQISQPQTADSAVQVLGPLEAAGLAFDHLWLCGMQGTSWPAAAHPNAFIPVSLQLQWQMPHASPERELAFAEALLTQYAGTTRVLHASYCRQTDGVPDLPSALLREFVPQAIREQAVVATQWTLDHGARVLEEMPDYVAPGSGGAHQSTLQGGSSLLEDQSQCPFRAFARHRLRVEPLGSFSVALSAADRGSLLHAALCALWGDLHDSATLFALNGLQLERTVTRAVQAAITAIPVNRRHALGAAYWRLEGQRLTALLIEWLLVESQRGAFSVVQRELDITLELAQLCITLRVDRVDQLPDGSRVIIDYKSGTCTVQDWLGDRPARPQLLLYAIAEPDVAATAALSFAQVRPRECRFVGLGRVAAADGIRTDIAQTLDTRMRAQDWRSLVACWRENLERLASAFVHGAAQVDPLTPASCTHCGLQPLCRVAASREIAEEGVE